MATPREVRLAVTKRVSSRVAVTKSNIRLRDYLLSENPQKSQVEILLGTLENKMKTLADHDKDVVAAIQNAFIDDADENLLPAKLEEDSIQVDEYVDSFLEMQIKAKRFLEGSFAESVSSASLRSSLPPSAFHVPEYKLPIFDGTDLLKFPGWFDNFKAVIDQSPYMSSVEKFAHLKAGLQGMPRDLVDGLLTTEANYKKATALLEESYGDPNLLLGLFVSKLHSYKAVHDPRHSSFQELIFGFERSFSEIQTLIKKLLPLERVNEACVDGDNLAWSIVSFFLAPHLISLLPDETQMKWFDRAVDPNERFNFSKLLEHLKNELKGRQTVAMLSSGGVGSQKPPRDQNNSRSHAATGAFVTTSRSSSCFFCKESGHFLSKCQKFLDQSNEDRVKFVNQSKLCVNCLRSRHATESCGSHFCCFNCHGRHHTVLCSEPKQSSKQKEDSTEPDQNLLRDIAETSVMTAIPKDSFVRTVVQVVPIIISVPNRQTKVKTFALFDNGAGHSWLKSDIAKQLQLSPIAKRTVQVDTFNQGKSFINSLLVECDIQGAGSSHISPLSIRPWTADKLTCTLSQTITRPLPSHLVPLDVFEAYDGRKVEVGLIIGQDYYNELMTDQRVLGQPTANKSLLGWTLSGRLPPSNGCSTSLSLFTHIKPEDAWDLSTIGIYDDPNALIDPYAEPQIIDGRYQVRLPFKSDQRPVSNYHQAVKRYHAMTGKQTALQKEEYDANLTNAYNQGYIERVDNANTAEGFFLPHRGEYGKKKLRVVFDGSATDQNGISLNSVLDPGPNMLALLVDVFQRFRLRKYPLVGDIVGAFHQLSLPPEDRIWVQFVWKNKVFRFTRVPFGLVSSPFLLLRTLHHHYNQIPRKLGEFLSLSTYMDDMGNSLDTAEERDAMFSVAKTTFASVGMNLRDPESRSMLGVPWNRECDQLSLDLSAIHPPSAYTRRALLRMIAGVFDPHGMMSPYLIRGRMLLQEAWKLGSKWDDVLPENLCQVWDAWMGDCQSYAVPRWIGYHSGDRLEFHVFCDASSTAYASVIYAVLPGKGVSSLLVSKARVTPLKTPVKGELTIPRAELMGLTIGTRLLKNTVDQLIKPDKVVFWTDATTVLSWLSDQGSAHKMIFVRNRINEIKKNVEGIPGFEFRYVPTHLNPADLPSRGTNVSSLNDLFWLHGPSFLLQPASEWPTTKVVTTLSVLTDESQDPPVLAAIDITKFSSLDRLLRVVAWTRRFINNRVFSRSGGHPLHTGPLNPEEISAAWECLVRIEQRKVYSEELIALRSGKDISRSSTLLKLRPFLCNTRQILQITPRTGESPTTLLPPKSHLTRLYVLEVHMKSFHPGGHGTLAEVRHSCWIPNGLSTVKKHLLMCRSCPRFKNQPFRLEEGSLPSFRTCPSPPFSTVGADHFGPMVLSSGIKVWVLLFTCPVTRAIHLELCRNYSAKEAKLRFRSFLALRVPPHQIVKVYSDNSKTFKKLSSMKFPSHQLDWKFIPEYTPNFGGWWERLIRTVKSALKITFHGVAFRRDILQVSLYEVAAMINRRPLTTISTEPSEGGPITPAHFLYGSAPPGYLSSHSTQEPELNLAEYARGRKHFSESFWKVWISQYLKSLSPWSNTTSKSPRLPGVGDIVLIKESSPRGQWPLGLIMELITDSRGNPRVARIKMGGIITRRSLRDLIPLECATSP